MEQEGQILMIGTQPDAKSSGWAKPRWIGAALICLTAVLCLGVGLGVAAARKQKPAHKTGASVAAKSAGKAKAASRRNGSLARAKAVALAKAKAGTRGRRGLTTASTMPPSPPARDYFGKQSGPAPLAARSIGSYVRGCLAGGKMLPVNGPAWQAMRLSRNRNWGHPLLVSYVEKLATDAQKLDNWPGLLVGDLAQPMGGPMVSGHASHQIGLDADIWLKPMPPKTLTNDERENISADSVITADQLAINPEVWQPGHVQLLKRAASYPNVARIFVHPAIKKALCEAPGTDRGWLSKVRPWWGHHYHFHVRLSCPPGAESCEDQPEAGADDGCGKEVESWLKRLKTPIIQKVPPVQKTPITMAQLPAECSKLVGYEPPPPVPMGPPLPGRKPPGIETAVTPVSAPPVKPAR
jgi:penicillin-insensitive murein endopeptidase